MLQTINFQEMSDSDYECYAGCDISKHNFLCEIVVTDDVKTIEGILIERGSFNLLAIENETGQTELHGYYYSDDDNDWGILIQENFIHALKFFDTTMTLSQVQLAIGNLSTENLF